MKIFFVIVHSILVLVAITVNAQEIYSADELKRIKYVNQLFSDQKYSEVIEYCSGILNVGKNSEAFRLRGMAYRVTGELEKAKSDLTEAVQYNRRDGRLYFEKGMVSMCLREFDKAAWEFTEAIRILNEQNPAYLKYNTLLLEERGRARHYLGFFKEAQKDFRIAVSYGSAMARVYLLSSLFRENSFSELMVQSDTMLKMHGRQPALLTDSTLYYYVSALNRLSQNIITPETERQVDAAVRLFKMQQSQCYQGFYYDLLYARANLLERSGNDSVSYETYRKIYQVNKQYTDIGAKIQALKMKMGFDMKPPEISIINPALDQLLTAKLPDTKTKVEIYAKVSDSSDLGLVTINNQPVYKIGDDGVFVVTLDLQPGKNEIIIAASDIMENKAEKKFFVELNEKYRSTDENINIPELVSNTRFHAILIAEKDYENNDFEDLTKPIVQVQELKHVLCNEYDFAPENILVLTNAKKSAILDSIEEKLNRLTPDDNIIIYYAGHGTVRKSNEMILGGYLIPSDARKGIWSSYISSEQLFSPAKYSEARHILYIVDACYSGALLRSSMDDAPASIKSMYFNKSRRMLTSGNLEKVPDNGYFFQNFIKYLREKETGFFPADDVYQFIMKNPENYTPQYDKITDIGDLGGRFIFVRKKVLGK